MRSIAIVGAGQSGLQLALGLLGDGGYEVTVVSDRTGQDVHDGRIMSSQFQFDESLDTERRLGISFWEDECPKTEGIGFNLGGPDGQLALAWSAKLDRPGMSVDQRVKYPRWMEEVRKRGGKLEIRAAGVPELEELASSHDLVLVASGKGEVGRLFERDSERSEFDRPMRALALAYVTGMKPREDFTAVSFSLVPGVGELFWFPGLTTTGACDMLVFEGVPGGPMDCFGEVKTPAEHLDKCRWIIESFMPWEAGRISDIALTDDNGILAGRFPPTVRDAVAKLPSGEAVFGMADVVVLNDPITGQGSNNASKCADRYLDAILARGDQPFDEAWMHDTFEGYWDYARWVTRWTNLLLVPPEPHVVELLGAAGQLPPLASRIANGFNHPPDYFPWWEDAGEAR
ncbi:MAG: styrene monooxygenase/indole monooxygenase family protein, partial [Solirubrobacteraceae bacterium]